ncbi:MAG: hypothetical protein WCN95_14775, partial [bacterium]
LVRKSSLSKISIARPCDFCLHPPPPVDRFEVFGSAALTKTTKHSTLLFSSPCLFFLRGKIFS